MSEKSLRHYHLCIVSPTFQQLSIVGHLPNPMGLGSPLCLRSFSVPATALSTIFDLRPVTGPFFAPRKCSIADQAKLLGSSDLWCVNLSRRDWPVIVISAIERPRGGCASPASSIVAGAIPNFGLLVEIEMATAAGI